MSKGGAFKVMRIGKGLLPPSTVVGRIGDVRDEGCPLSHSLMLNYLGSGGDSCGILHFRDLHPWSIHLSWTTAFPEPGREQ